MNLATKGVASLASSHSWAHEKILGDREHLVKATTAL